MGHEEGEEASVAVTNYRVSRRIMRRSLLSRFTVTLINSKKPHLSLSSPRIYTHIYLKLVNGLSSFTVSRSRRHSLRHCYAKTARVPTSVATCPPLRLVPRASQKPKTGPIFAGTVCTCASTRGARARMGRQAKCVDTESRRGRRGIGHSPHP